MSTLGCAMKDGCDADEDDDDENAGVCVIREIRIGRGDADDERGGWMGSARVDRSRRIWTDAERLVGRSVG